MTTQITQIDTPTKAKSSVKHQIVSRMDWDDDKLIISAFGFPKLRSVIQFLRLPFFSLENKDMEILEFTSSNGQQKITITPAHGYGRPTVYDKDFIVYVISHIQTQLDLGNIKPGTPNHLYVFDALELFENINRKQKRNISKSSDTWQDLKDAGQRLLGSTITTDIEFGGNKVSAGHGFVNSFTLYENETDKKMYFGIQLADWIYSAIMHPKSKEILTIDQEYFKIKHGLRRRVYEIIRQNRPLSKLDIPLQELQALTGSKIADIYDFKSTLKKKFAKEIAQKNSKVNHGYSFDFMHWTITVYGLNVRINNPTRIKQVEKAVVDKYKSKQAAIKKRYKMS